MQSLLKSLRLDCMTQGRFEVLLKKGSEFVRRTGVGKDIHDVLLETKIF